MNEMVLWTGFPKRSVGVHSGKEAAGEAVPEHMELMGNNWSHFTPRVSHFPEKDTGASAGWALRFAELIPDRLRPSET